MKPDIKKLYIEELESGKYKQGFGKNRNESKDGTVLWCAFGVLTHLWVINNLITPEVFRRSDWSDLCQWAGISNEDITSIALKNDRERLTFSEIAEYVEENM